ncbi:MAG: glycosyltransferase family 4 protein [Salinivenus sp.]
MHVTFLVPRIHDRPTGGNVYNRHVAKGLRAHATVEIIPWPPGADLPTAPLPSDPVVLIDSLLASRPDDLDALRTAHPAAAFVLVGHYLHCIDPTVPDAPAAAPERALLSWVDGVVVTSPFARRALVDEGLAARRIAVAPPGLAPTYRRPVAERSLNAPPHLLTVASLLPGKGLPRLLDVLARLADQPWTWTLVGDDTLDPDFAASLRRQIDARSFSDRVTVTGAVPPDDLQAHYDRADVFVLPSRFETCSMATREAMARGCPVVAFAVGGLPNNFGDAPAGRLIPPDDTDAFASALRSLLDDPAARRRMGLAARKQSQSFPSWPTTADRVRAALRRLR